MHIYKSYDTDQLENLFSQFLINSWSYSKVTSFARNEKAFEMNYIFGVFSKNSSSAAAGKAYHKALELYFTSLKLNGEAIELPELEQIAFQHIAEIPANFWKLQKTTPTVEECIIKANKTATALLYNFISENNVYTDDIAVVLDVEVRCEEFLTVNCVDIPLPCHLVIDLVVRTKSGKIAIIDHKSKSTFTSEEEIALSIGCQAITYVLGYEAKTGLNVDEVWFVENKYSQNKDRSSQLNAFKLPIDSNTRKLYEALLYEPLKRMLEAVNDPDHTYIINQSDNFIDMAELYDFWARTMICDVEDFNVEESKKELVAKRLRKIKDSSIEMINPSIIKKFKANAAAFIQYDLSKTDMTQAQKIEHILKTFGATVKVAHEFDGYSSNTYLLDVSAGVKVSSIYSKRLDIANALDVSNVRISSELVIYEGKSYLGIDFTKKREKNLMFDEKELNGLKIPLGKDNLGSTIVWDLANQSTPHALICGTTGSGKSVLIKSIIHYALLAGVKNIVIFDPKLDYADLPPQSNVHIFHEIEDIETKAKEIVEYMDNLQKTKREELTLVIFEEFADAIGRAKSGNELNVYETVQDGIYANGNPKLKRVVAGRLKSLEENLQILVQKGRSCGMRVIAATQRADVKVINGNTKTNFPVRICLQMPTDIDSKVVLDEEGAKGLAGKGDALIKSPEYINTTRFQAFYKP
jgi:hypothetical protein